MFNAKILLNKNEKHPDVEAKVQSVYLKQVQLGHATYFSVMETSALTGIPGNAMWKIVINIRKTQRDKIVIPRYYRSHRVLR